MAKTMKLEDKNRCGLRRHGLLASGVLAAIALIVVASTNLFHDNQEQRQLRRSLQEVPPPPPPPEQQQPPPPPEQQPPPPPPPPPEQQQEQQPPPPPPEQQQPPPPPPPQPEGGVPQVPPPPPEQQPPPEAAEQAQQPQPEAVQEAPPIQTTVAIPPPPLIGDAAAGSGLPRPVMHTFYSRIDPTVHHKNTAMSDQADEALIEAWKVAWSEAGWEPKVLTLEDAQRHPHFERFDEALSELPFGYYDRLCFLRWIAMAASGGGFMSDYDTFPLNSAITSSVPLPHNGRLTVYNRIPAGGGVPCLVSGTAQEWDRVGRLLIDNAVAHKRAHFWSDMFALVDIDLQAHSVHYEIEHQVVAGHRVLTGQHWGPQECESITQGMRAVHFSHDALDRGTLRDGEAYEDRPSIAIRWVRMWKERCPPSNVPR